MAFGGGSSNDVEIKVKVDADGAIKAFDKLGNELEHTSTQAQKASSGFSATQASIVTLQAGVALAAQAFSFAADNIGKVFDVVSQGSQIDDVSSAFEELSTQAGVVGDTLLNKLNTALADTVPNVQLMQQANELLIGGLKPDQIELLASAARTLGERTGVDAAQGMAALSDSLLKGNDRALKTLGIVVDNNKALKDFADKQGIAVELLSETAKVEAIRQASLKALAEQQERFTKATVDGGDRVAQINKVLVDAFNEVKKTIAGDAGVNASLDKFLTTLKSIDYGAVANGFITIANAILGIVTAAAEAAGAIAAFANKTSAFDRAVGSMTTNSKTFNDELGDVIDLLGKDTKEATIKAREEFTKLGAKFTELGASGKLTSEEVVYLNKQFSDTAAQVKESSKQFGLLKEETEKTIKPIEKVSTGLIDVIKQSDLAKQKAKELEKQGLEALKEEAKKLDAELDKLAENDWATKMQADIADAMAEDGGIFGNLFSGIFGDGTAANEAAAISQGKKLGLALTDGLQAGLLAALNGASGEELRATLTKGLSDIAGAAFPKAKPFIDFAEPFLEQGIEHIFGGEHAGTTARKAADKFFADAFDANRLSIIVNDQLVQIKDLVFKGDTLFGGSSNFTDGSFSGFFASLSDEAKAAFSGVGAAFEELLGVGDEISGQIASVLANNIGGSLNNLQLLVQASGKSFEELRTSVVDAFLDGKLSALEAQTALNGLAQVAQDGIPDAIGATVQAFDNMKAAGAKGGRALIDAFKDIGFEAKELGIKDFGALAQNIIQSGKYSTEQVGQFFDELRKQGITNVEQLANASTEQLLSIGSALQASGFLEEASKDAGELIQSIKDLPTEKVLNFRIKTEFDANTLKAQELGYTPKTATKIDVAGSPTSH